MTVTPELTYEDHRAAMSNTDDADTRTVLLAILSCAQAWEGSVRILGNVRASDAVRALSAALSVPAAAVVGEPVAWKLAPIEPTPEMASKGADAFFSPQPQSIEDENARAASVYRRMLAAAPSAPDGWRPIDSAPKDGTEILAWSGFWDKHHLVRWNQGENAWCEGSWCFGSVPDMVWLPLPAPPALGGKP